MIALMFVINTIDNRKTEKKQNKRVEHFFSMVVFPIFVGSRMPESCKFELKFWIRCKFSDLEPDSEVWIRKSKPQMGKSIL